MNTKIASLLTTAVVTGLLASQAVKAEGTAKPGNTSEKAAGEKGACCGEEGMKKMKKEGKSGCCGKGGCGGRATGETNAVDAKATNESATPTTKPAGKGR